MFRRRIVMEYNKEADQWEWEIQQFVPTGFATEEWCDIEGDDFAGQNENPVEAFENARTALTYVKGT